MADFPKKPNNPNGDPFSKVARQVGEEERRFYGSTLTGREVGGYARQIGVEQSLPILNPEVNRLSKLGATEFRAEEKKYAEMYSRSLEGLKDTTNKTQKELDELTESLSRATEGLRNLAGAAERGGGQNAIQRFLSSDRGRNFSAGLQGLQSIVSAGIEVNQAVNVNQRLGEMNNVAGLASLANQRYDLYVKARQGDVLSQLTLSRISGADKFGQEVKQSSRYSAMGMVGAGLLAAGAGALTLASLPVTAGIGVASLAAGGATISGLATAGISAFDLYRNVTPNQTRIAATQSQTAAIQELLRVRATQIQGYRDLYVGMGVAARGAGVGAEQFMKSEFTPNAKYADPLLDKMTELRMSPQEMMAASQFGFQNFGRRFNIAQVQVARRLEQASIGDLSQNLQGMATLFQAGANNPGESFANVVSAAFSKALTDAPTLKAIVDNTAGIVTTSVGTRGGLDVSEQVAKMMTRATNEKADNQPFAVKIAANAMQTATGIMTDTSLSFTGLVNRARVSRLTKLQDPVALQNVTGIDPATLQRIAEMTTREEQAAALRNFGVIGARASNVSAILEGRQAAYAESFLGAAGAFMAPGQYEKLARKIPGTTFEKLSVKEQETLGAIGSQYGMTAETAFRQITALQVSKDAIEQKKKQEVNSIISGKTKLEASLMADVDVLKTSGGLQSTQAIKAASTAALASDTKLNELVVDLIRKQEKEGLEKEKAAGATATKTVDANTEFGKAAATLGTAADKWDRIADNLINAGIGQKSAGAEFFDSLFAKSGKSSSQ